MKTTEGTCRGGSDDVLDHVLVAAKAAQILRMGPTSRTAR
jgi:hypothetical protein